MRLHLGTPRSKLNLGLEKHLKESFLGEMEKKKLGYRRRKNGK